MHGQFQRKWGAMEVEAALVLWKRSTQHQMRYTVLVGDGDTKTFLALSNGNIYGGDCPIEKEECVNHVSKRLNTGLRNLKSSLSKKSIRIGGNAKGSLSDPKIGLLQSYYTRAVRGNNELVEEMSRAIWAAFFHSTDRHHDCPAGSDSWCWFQRDIAAGIAEPQLSTRKTSTFMNELVAEHVKGVYERLTDPSLLKRCLLGKAQNSNESLHSLIWARCPKHL
ncbi:hypothetical protein PoB_003083200 [Plakobranchus ocellatus]|uniref:Mutator-like transposase domain-containing protein n=1 Tax=Plakobranchus ocellatus TaxID=259542 RepID=A0AAV4AAS6_9GAST|nr:hypothetical protein PoB_003083200 [Plakobranchus ocellatus]